MITTHLKIMVYSIVAGLGVSLSAEPLFDPHTGLATQAFREEIAIAHIFVEQHVPEYHPFHVVNIHHTLQSNGCFQSDYEFYKKGGHSDFSLTADEARAYLDHEYAANHEEDIFPRYMPGDITEPVDVIVTGGIIPTMKKVLGGVKKALDKGYVFNRLIFIARNKDKEVLSQVLQDEVYAELRDIPTIQVLLADDCVELADTALKLLANKGKLSSHYVIATTSIYAKKAEIIAAHALDATYTCKGIIAQASKDWYTDMVTYGYLEALGSPEEAMIAWACSSWNFKARQVHAELKAWEARVR